MNWEAIQALATLLAVILALSPIWREDKRAAAHARNLRLRIGAKLIMLRPTLVALSRPGEAIARSSPGFLHAPEFLECVRDLDGLQAEAPVLNSDEQDQLGITMLNLNMFARVYNRDGGTPGSAANVLTLIDDTKRRFENYGLITTRVNPPWDSDAG